MNAEGRPPASEGIPADDVLIRAIQRELAVALRGLAFGQITLVVHDGAIVQIDRLERKRLRPGLDVTSR
jgi:hypothetical protein